MRKDGRDMRRVTSFPGAEHWPSWLGDSVLFFDANIHGNEEIYSIRVDGSLLQRLTSDTIAYDGVVNVSYSGKVIFDSNREQDQLADIWVMDADGDNQRQLTIGPQSHGHGVWSRDEGSIVFKTRESEKVQNLFAMNPDGSEVRQLTSDQSVNMHPSWLPDGTKLVFTSNRDGDFDLYLLDLENRSQEKITHNDYPEYRPSYSPDGKQLLFCARVNDKWDIFLMDVDSGESICLTKDH